MPSPTNTVRAARIQCVMFDHSGDSVATCEVHATIIFSAVRQVPPNLYC